MTIDDLRAENEILKKLLGTTDMFLSAVIHLSMENWEPALKARIETLTRDNKQLDEPTQGHVLFWTRNSRNCGTKIRALKRKPTGLRTSSLSCAGIDMSQIAGCCMTPKSLPENFFGRQLNIRHVKAMPFLRERQAKNQRNRDTRICGVQGMQGAGAQTCIPVGKPALCRA